MYGCQSPELITKHRNVGFCRIVRRRLNRIDTATWRQAREALHLCQVSPLILRDIDRTVVRTRPDHPCLYRRLAQRIDSAVVLLTSNVTRDRTAGNDLLVFFKWQSGPVRSFPQVWPSSVVLMNVLRTHGRRHPDCAATHE